MKVEIKGKGTFTLNKSDFVASGGEGSVYRKGDIGFKIYHDASKMIPIAKIDELSILGHPCINKPQDILLDEKHRPIGYTTRFLKDTHFLCQLFTKAFKDREGVTAVTVLELIEKLQALVAHCHSKGILIVDLNETNFLVAEKYDQIFAIDCDSYQTKSFPCPVLMDSIRDRHASDTSNGKNSYSPTQGTDWFSFGILSFQMMIGIHPFRGGHPKLKTLDERMLKNVSVLNKDVKMPPVCYPFSVIPDAYLSWYKAVFEKGERIAPPSSLQPVVFVAAQVKIAGSNKFIIKKLQHFPEDIVHFDNAARLVVTTMGVYNGKSLDAFSKPPVLGVTPKGAVFAATIEQGKVSLTNLTRGTPIKIDRPAEQIMTYNGRLYARHDEYVYEVGFLETGQDVITDPQRRVSILANATRMFSGVVVQDLIGACYISVFPNPEQSQQIHIKELDGYRIIDAKYDTEVFMAIAFKNGQYDKFVFRIDSDSMDYDARTEKDVGAIALNFVALETGRCIDLNHRDEIELFSTKMGSKSTAVFQDPAISGDMRLFKKGTQVLFSKREELYSIEVKP